MKIDGKDTFERTHPSYGMLAISRTHGGTGQTRLFGSSLAAHYGTIRLTISRAVWRHELHRDWYHDQNQLIEIEMSAAQFADAITSLNQGAGTPCTIRMIAGHPKIDPPPDHATEAEYIRDTFDASLGGFIEKAREYRKAIEKHTEKLSEKARREIKIALDVIEDQMASNVPFVIKQFNEATTKIATAAKAEVEAFVSGTIRAAGLQSIAEGRLPSLLPSGRAHAPHCTCCECNGHETVDGACRVCGHPT